MATEVLPVAEIKERIGNEIGVSDWVDIDQKRINAFADCTGDHQWIHLIPAFSAGISVVPEGTMMAINYGMNKLRFVNPVKVDSKVRDRVSLTNVEEKGGGRVLVTTTHTVEIDGEEKPACIAETLTMFFTQ
jgi:acyl dehydratase